MMGKQQIDDIRKRAERVLISWIKLLNEEEFNEVFFYVGNLKTIETFFNNGNKDEKRN